MNQDENNLVDQEMVRRNHLYRGMIKLDYHDYFDSMYNLLMDEQFINNSKKS